MGGGGGGGRGRGAERGANTVSARKMIDGAAATWGRGLGGGGGGAGRREGGKGRMHRSSQVTARASELSPLTLKPRLTLEGYCWIVNMSDE